MLRLGYQDFASLIEHIDKNIGQHETENRLTLFKAIYKQVQNYKNRNTFRHPDGSEIEGEAEQVHYVFSMVAAETGLKPRTKRQRESDRDPVGNSLNRYQQLPKGNGKGDWDFTTAIYYWFHRNDARLPFAAQIDKAVFGQPFHVRFNLTRDEYTPLIRDERDFNIGPLLFSCDAEAASLTVPSEPLGSILDAGRPSPAKALSWRYALTDLVGRHEDRASLIKWAKDSPGELSMRLLSGVGGSGKTRLASEIVSRLKEEGQKWNTGFLGKHSDGVTAFFTPMDGVLLVIDDPEERMGFVQALIDGLRDRSKAHVSVRILLLSRLDEAHWRHASTALGHRFSVQPANATGALNVEDAHALVSQAFSKLATMTNSERQVSDHVRDWLELDEQHCLPLFATAAAVHAFLVPENAFGLNGAEVLEALAEIEIDRVRAYSKSVGLGDYGLERLLALATFSQGGLSQSAIETLRDNGLPLDLNGQALIDALAKTPWWVAENNAQDGVLEKLSPDRIAVAFLALTLLNAKISRLPEWLVFVMTPHGADVGAVVGRLLFDVSIHGERYRQALDQLMLKMLDADYGGIQAFQNAAYREHTSLSAPFAITLISTLVEQAKTPRQRAGLLHNLATNLQTVERYEEALEAHERCIALRRRAAFWPWSDNADKRALAISLGNYANCLGEVGQTEKAAEISRQALKLRRRIAKHAPDEERRGLAISLTNAADLKIAEGQSEEAVQLASEAVAILQEIQKKERGKVESDLARALHNLGKAQSLSGEAQEALSNVQRTVSMRRKLYTDDAHAHGRDFGDALINLSKLASSARDFELAKNAAREALPIFKALDQAEPELHKSSLANAHLVFGDASFELGDLEDAYKFADEAVRLFKSSDWQSDPKTTAELTESGLLISMCWSALGNFQKAVDSALDAMRVLDEANEHPDLQLTYINAAMLLSMSFAENGENDKAASVSGTMVQNLRELRLEDTPNVDVMLRKALEFHSEQLRIVGNTDAAALVAVEIQALDLIASQK